MNTITINKLLDKIKEGILQQAGHGFTKEVCAEIVKYQVYMFKEPSLWEEFVKEKREGEWIPIKILKEKKYLSCFFRRNEDKIENVDWDIEISKELERELPQGITVCKDPPSVLYDGRNYGVRPFYLRDAFIIDPANHQYLIDHHKIERVRNGRGYTCENNGRKTAYIEGHRVYINVSDEYASRVFNEVCNSKYPFRNYLLEKYDQILRDFAINWELSSYHGQALIELSGVRIRGKYGDYGYDWYSINYESLGLTNLKTYEQLYGMAIALIDTKKKISHEWMKANYNIRIKDNTCICIDVFFSKPELEKPSKNQLKEW